MAKNKIKTNFDVIIVGGGPAGLFGAHYLAENSNLDILVIDKGKAPLDHRLQEEHWWMMPSRGLESRRLG